MCKANKQLQPQMTEPQQITEWEASDGWAMTHSDARCPEGDLLLASLECHSSAEGFCRAPSLVKDQTRCRSD